MKRFFTTFTLLILIFALVVSVVSAENTTLKEILEKGKMVVGINAMILPLGYTEATTGKIVGLTPDLLKLYTDKLGVELELRDFEWNGLFGALETKKVDFLAPNLTTTIPRTAILGLTDPVLFTGSRAIVAVDSKIKTAADLNSEDITFAQTKGSVYVKVVGRLFPKAKILQFDNFLDDLNAIASGRADVNMDDELVILFVGLKGHLDKFRVLEENFASNTYRWTARMDDYDLIKSINVFLQEVRLNGTYKELYEKWFEQPWNARVIGY